MAGRGSPHYVSLSPSVYSEPTHVNLHGRALSSKGRCGRLSGRVAKPHCHLFLMRSLIVSCVLNSDIAPRGGVDFGFEWGGGGGCNVSINVG
jgi:hypothetical protein